MIRLDAPVDAKQLSTLLGRHDEGVVVLLDLQLAAVNENKGWAAGDQVLEAFAAMLRRALRAQDTTVRTAGQQFVLLLPGTCADDCSTLLDRLRALWERRAPYPCAFQAAAVPVETTARAALDRATRENSTALARLAGQACDIVHQAQQPEVSLQELQLALLSVRALLRATSADEVSVVMDSVVESLGDVGGRPAREALLTALRDDARLARRRLVGGQDRLGDAALRVVGG